MMALMLYQPSIEVRQGHMSVWCGMELATILLPTALLMFSVSKFQFITDISCAGRFMCDNH